MKKLLLTSLLVGCAVQATFHSEKYDFKNLFDLWEFIDKKVVSTDKVNFTIQKKELSSKGYPISINVKRDGLCVTKSMFCHPFIESYDVAQDMVDFLQEYVRASQEKRDLYKKLPFLTAELDNLRESKDFNMGTAIAICDLHRDIEKLIDKIDAIN